VKKLSALLLVALNFINPLLSHAADAVITQTAKTFILSNAQVTATIDRKSGDLVSMTYHGLELMGHGRGHPAGYWEQDPSHSAHLLSTVSIDPASNGGERAEISIKGTSDGSVALGAGPGGSTFCDIELRYGLGRQDSGVYAYAIYTHLSTYPATQIGESRFGVKLNSRVFDWLSIDKDRNKLMLAPEDWAKGTQLNMKEARMINTGIYKGQVEHKYDYSALQYTIPAFGWSSTTQHIGFWFINPSMEFLSGGPTKVELTGHLDLTDTADPTLLDYWRGTHYGGSVLTLKAGEVWSKVVGPIFLYCNYADTPKAMWQDALNQAKQESTHWPYAWVKNVDYPNAAERSTVTGHVIIKDPQAPDLKPNHMYVGLSAPDWISNSKSYRGGNTQIPVTWQTDAKYYQFWSTADTEGNFTLSKVRAGHYTLHAISDGVLGEYARADIIIKPGEVLNLGDIVWAPVRYGKQLWDIGIANRSAIEFAHGNDYWHWGLYLKYPEWFPEDVHYIVGQSNFLKDWNFEHVPHASSNDGSGRAHGDATPWTITFNLKDEPKGNAILRLAIVGVGTRFIDVTVNGNKAGQVNNLVPNSVIHRDGIQGSWVEKDINFAASLMHAGNNTLTLTIPAGSVTSGIEYDYLRLELDESAKP
jgi:rhamnogalacturonan endolyase